MASVNLSTLCSGSGSKRRDPYACSPPSALALFLLLLVSARHTYSDVDLLSCSDDADNNDGLPATRGSPVCIAQDRQALLQFKASISSDPNKALSGWNRSSNCCSWNGITCDETGRVVRVKLPQQKLKGSISASLGALSALKVLVLYENSLSGSLPTSIGNLSKLQRLCFSGNTISGSIPASFSKLSNLQLLDLSYNDLAGTLPAGIGGMTSLQRLRLYNNKIGGSIPASFGLLSNLYNADLGFNRLSGRIPSGFASGLSSLLFLYLQNNRITGLPADMRKLTSLQWVDLSNNPIASSDALAGLATAPLISQIELASCGLKGPFPSWVSRLPQPDFTRLSDEVTPSLTLSNNAISGPIPAWLGKLTNLEGLSLDHNQLTGSIPASFSNLQSLRFFNVSYNQLSGKIPQVAPFTTFSTSAYQPGNPGLCGTPLTACK
ncbi:hypothetical protein GOP47_0002232 [Adiantum capillus-veneris]|uniref:Leucine-rich repeat-containing N-terminal plant-type domain-containing protein n=1 Tax=Adiantum capillus-veneris TaxID=13818 RepID=A0A9D4VAJ2_ADICA|nr:hypothetical protein GOP47_0002232 [Adiantum capillus-veneris]